MNLSKKLAYLILAGGLSLISPAFSLEKSEKNEVERQIESKSYYVTRLNDLDKAKKMDEIEYDAEIVKLAMKGLKAIIFGETHADNEHSKFAAKMIEKSKMFARVKMFDERTGIKWSNKNEGCFKNQYGKINGFEYETFHPLNDLEKIVKEVNERKYLIAIYCGADHATSFWSDGRYPPIDEKITDKAEILMFDKQSIADKAIEKFIKTMHSKENQNYDEEKTKMDKEVKKLCDTPVGIYKISPERFVYLTNLEHMPINDNYKKLTSQYEEISSNKNLMKALKSQEFKYGNTAYFEFDGKMYSGEMNFGSKEKEINIYFKDGKISKITGIDKEEGK